MTSTTTHDTIGEWATLLTTASTLSEVLGIHPCEALHNAYPAIVGEEETMGALASLLTPVMEIAGQFVAGGVVSADDAEEFVHNVFHLLQIAAGLGHMLGVADALGEGPEMPGDLSEIAWASLPDTFGESDEDEGRQEDV